MKGHNLIDPSKVTKVTVAAGSCLKLEVNATSSDQILRFVAVLVKNVLCSKEKLTSNVCAAFFN